MSTLLFALFGLIATASAAFTNTAGGSALGTGGALLGDLQTANQALTNTGKQHSQAMGTSSMLGAGQGLNINSLTNVNSATQGTGGFRPAFGAIPQGNFNSFGQPGFNGIAQPGFGGIVQPGFNGGAQPFLGGGVPVNTGVGMGGFPVIAQQPTRSDATASALGTGSALQGILSTNNAANTQTNRHGATGSSMGNMAGSGQGVQISQLSNTQANTGN